MQRQVRVEEGAKFDNCLNRVTINSETMDSLDDKLTHDALHDLTELERRAEKLRDVQTQFNSRHTNVIDLQSRIAELRLKRNTLKKQLKQANAEEDGASDMLDVSEEMAALLAKREHLEDLRAAYRVLGKSVTVVDRQTILLCFDACHRGRYGPPHYVELKFGKQGARITRHTLPIYVPIDVLKERLEEGIRPLMTTVFGYLQAEVIRQQAARFIQEEYGDRLVGEIMTTPSYDYIQMTMDCVPYCRGAPVVIQLKYNDLTKWRPTRVKITVQDEDLPDQGDDGTREREVSKIVTLFTERDLEDAVKFLLPEVPQ